MPLATCQVDLDGLWAIQRCYGRNETPPEDEDPVYAEGLPRFLELFEELGVKATFFVVGRDAQVAWKATLLRQAHDAGHELANHSLTHPLDLAALDRESLRREIDGAQQAIQAGAGVLPVGFRAPGYSLSPALLEALEERGFLYDASLLPTRWGWALRLLTRWMSVGPTSATQYGGGWRGPRPLEAFAPGPGPLLEIPVAVSPVLRLPCHGGVALTLGARYLNACLERLRRRGLPLHYVWHGVDLTGLGARELTGRGRGARFFSRRPAQRLEFVKAALQRIRQSYEITTLRSAAATLQTAAKKNA